MFDYEVLRFIWWVLVGVLLIGFAVTDGFDMGVGILVRIIGKTDTERRVMINSIAPHWDGNQVWLITAGGALFAAWPMVYAAAFWLLRRHDPGAGRLVLPPGRFRLPLQAGEQPLAQHVGLGHLHRLLRACRGIRRGVRQPAAGRAVPHGRVHAPVLHR